MKTKHFLNLTNGIEFANELNGKGIDYEFIRIQSTTIERKDWIKLFNDLDHNFLLNLAIGNKCLVYDCGTNRLNSKTIYYAIPLIRYILNREWHGITPETVYIGNRNNIVQTESIDYFNHIFNSLFTFNTTKEKQAVKTKLRYYKRFLNSNEVLIEGVSKSTSNDGNYSLYKEMLITENGK